MDSLKVRSSELLDKKQKVSQTNEEIELKSNSTKFRTVQCFSIKRKLIMATLTDFLNTYSQSAIKVLIGNLHVRSTGNLVVCFWPFSIITYYIIVAILSV